MIFPLNSALIGPASERPDPHDPTIPRNGSTPSTYICIDTLEVFQDVGTGWLLVGTLAFSGLAADGSDGIAVTGAVTAPTLAFTPTAATGAPSTGAHNAGEMVMDAVGAIFACTLSGTPGTWKQFTLV